MLAVQYFTTSAAPAESVLEINSIAEKSPATQHRERCECRQSGVDASATIRRRCVTNMPSCNTITALHASSVSFETLHQGHRVLSQRPGSTNLQCYARCFNLPLLLDCWLACAKVNQYAEPRFGWESLYSRLQLFRGRCSTIVEIPVTFPPGRLKLAINPDRTGSVRVWTDDRDLLRAALIARAVDIARRCNDDIGFEINELLSQWSQAIVLAFGKSVGDVKVTTLDIALPSKTLEKYPMNGLASVSKVPDKYPSEARLVVLCARAAIGHAPRRPPE